MPPAPDPDIIGVLSRAGKARTWALELKSGRAEEERRRGRRRGNPYPLIKAVNIERLPTRLKTRLFPRVVQTARLDYPRPY